MAEIQKFIFNNNYSTAPENMQKIQEERILNARTLLKNEFEIAKEEAFNKGLRQGEQAALQKLEEELQSHVDTISSKISELEKHKQEVFKILEEQSLVTVRHLIKQMFFEANELFPEKIIQQSLENAMQHVPFSTKILIKVPSNCKAYLNDIKLSERLSNKGINDYSIVEDNSLSNGDCEIQWDKSGVLSSKKDSLNKIMSTLDNFLKQEDVILSEEFKNSKNKEDKEENDNLTPQLAEESSKETNSVEI